MKDWVKNVLRWGLAGLLLFWLFKSGKLSGLRDLDKFFASPGFFALACLGMITNYVLNFFRWRMLLTGVDVIIPFSQVVRLSMIGQFFSIFMPGSVGGDLVKAVYIAKSYPKQRTDVVASILLDRILGFLTLMAFATFFFVLSFDATRLPRSLQGFGTILGLGTLALFMIVLVPGRASRLLNHLNLGDNFLQKALQRIAKMLRSFARHPLTILKALAISFVSQAGSMLAMYLIGASVFGPLPWGTLDGMRFISAAAVGTTASALPLSPMGLGVGQIAFGKVFVLLGAPDEHHGILIISAIQIISFVLNLMGALWFLRSKKEVQQATN